MIGEPTLIYLAQAIDQADVEHVGPVRTFKERLTSTISNKPYAVYSPASAWSADPTTVVRPDKVESVNQAALAQADLMLAIVYPGIRSTGVWFEIAQAVARGCKVVVVNVSPNPYHLGISLASLVATGKVEFWQSPDAFWERWEQRW